MNEQSGDVFVVDPENFRKFLDEHGSELNMIPCSASHCPLARYVSYISKENDVQVTRDTIRIKEKRYNTSIFCKKYVIAIDVHLGDEYPCPISVQKAIEPIDHWLEGIL